MRQKCNKCGEHANCNDDGICFGCIQDDHDLADWLPEDEESDEDEEEG